MAAVWITSGGTRLFVVEEGEGPALVMLHGAMASHHAVRSWVQPLAPRYRVITPDLRGSGKSWSSVPLTFDQLAGDVLAVLDHLGVSEAVVGGASSGSGAAVRLALRHPQRVRGLIIAMPVYAGADKGYTPSQRAAFEAMHEVAARAPGEGIDVLRPLYARLPEAWRDRAWAVAAQFDPASVAASSHFIVSGQQPFGSAADLEQLNMPTLLLRGDDPQHPSEVSEVYASSVRHCTVLPATTADLTGAIGEFCDRCWNRDVRATW